MFCQCPGRSYVESREGRCLIFSGDYNNTILVIFFSDLVAGFGEEDMRMRKEMEEERKNGKEVKKSERGRKKRGYFSTASSFY